MCALISIGAARTVQVVDVAANYAPAGTRGPALVNLQPYLAYSHGHGITIGPPYGTTLIGLHQGFYGAHGFVPPPTPIDHSNSDGSVIK